MLVRVEFSTPISFGYFNRLQKFNTAGCRFAFMKGTVAYYYINSDCDSFYSEEFTMLCIRNETDVIEAEIVENKELENLFLLVNSGGNSSFDLPATKIKMQKRFEFFEKTRFDEPVITTPKTYYYNPNEYDDMDDLLDFA